MKAVTSHEFLTLADELIQSTTSPIKIRAAVSRAYYGAYHAANSFQDALPSKGIVVREGGGVHEQLIQCLENPTLPRSDDRFLRSKSLGILLRRVRKCRNDADYEIETTLSLDVAETSVAEAKKIVSKSVFP